MVVIYVFEGENLFITYSAIPKCPGLNNSKFITRELSTIPVNIPMAAITKYKVWMFENLFLTYGTSVFLVIHDDFWESLKWLYSKEYCSGGKGWQQCEFSQPLTPETPLLIKFGKRWLVQLAQKWQDCKMCVATWGNSANRIVTWWSVR